MTDQEINALVAHGISAFNAGDHDRAYALFVQALQTNPQHEVGWLWMSAVVREAAERRYCLEQVLAINPQHQAAQRGLTKFPGDLPSRSPLPPQPAAPVNAPAAPVNAPAAPVNAPAAPVSAPAVPVSAPAAPVSAPAAPVSAPAVPVSTTVPILAVPNPSPVRVIPFAIRIGNKPNVPRAIPGRTPHHGWTSGAFKSRDAD